MTCGQNSAGKESWYQDARNNDSASYIFDRDLKESWVAAWGISPSEEVGPERLFGACKISSHKDYGSKVYEDYNKDCGSHCPLRVLKFR